MSSEIQKQESLDSVDATKVNTTKIENPFAKTPLTHTPAPHEYPGSSGQIAGEAIAAQLGVAAEFAQSPSFDQSDAIIQEVNLAGQKRIAFTIDGLYSLDECSKLIELSEAQGFEHALVNVENTAQKAIPKIRNNYRTMIDDESTASVVWQRVAKFCPQLFKGCRPSCLNERLRFLRYDVGQKFDAHMDGTYLRQSGPRKGERSYFTFQLYLNEDFEGGTTCFLDSVDDTSGVDVIPKVGRVLIFEHDILHRGAPPTSGRKYVLRTDIMYAPLQ